MEFKRTFCALIVGMFLVACGGEENEICSQGGQYESCTYVLKYNGCEGNIDVRPSWEGSLTLNLVNQFCTEYSWTEGPFWWNDPQGGQLCEVNVFSTAFPIDVNRLVGLGTVYVTCDMYYCNYQAAFDCTKRDTL